MSKLDLTGYELKKAMYDCENFACSLLLDENDERVCRHNENCKICPECMCKNCLSSKEGTCWR